MRLASLGAALRWYEGGNKEAITVLLLSSFGVWLCLNLVFFLSIERSFVETFFGTTTGPSYTVQLFREAPSDELRFDAAFTNTRSFIAECEEEVKEWMAENYGIMAGEEWFRVEVSERADGRTSKRTSGDGPLIYYLFFSLGGAVGAGRFSPETDFGRVE